jgi:hypothetical protein
VNTGPWVRSTRRLSGYFTTVWRKERTGNWKWILDVGDSLTIPRAAGDRPTSRRASCSAKAPMPPAAIDETNQGAGHSPDGTLVWNWKIGGDGAGYFKAWLWDGRRMILSVDDQIAA